MATYLFIDGGYLRTNYSNSVRRWFGSNGEIDFRLLNAAFNAERCFFYDALEDEKRENETEESFNARLATDEAYFDRIQELNGYFVRLGSLTGRKNRRQKKVDILLAVEALDHAVRRNMKRAILLTGDRDFEPLVNSLVQLGIRVEVAGDKRTTSRHLRHAADIYHRLSFDEYHSWTIGSLRTRFPISIRSINAILTPEMTAYETGSFQGKNATLLRRHISGADMYYIYVEGFYDHATSLLLEANDLETLRLYFELQHGQITWN